MLIFDHVFMALLFGVQPIFGYYSHQRFKQAIERGDPPGRVTLYTQTMAIQWTAFGVFGATWLGLGRPVQSLGFRGSDTVEIATGGVLLAVVCTAMLYAWSSTRSMTTAQKAEQVEGLGDLRHYLPENRRDFRYFVATSTTAGIVEEVLYRGFAFWYLAAFMPIWAVIAASSIAFGLGHGYQGVAGMAKVSLVGAAFGLVYVWTGSIWFPMLLHAVFDILQGLSILEVMKARSDEVRDAGKH